MKTRILIVLLLVQGILSYAQSEQNIWAFGEGAGLNFNLPGPAPYSDNLFPGQEGCASVCDAAGNMLFYTNGFWVWDKHNHLMPALTGGVPGYISPLTPNIGYPPLMPYLGGAATQEAAICNIPAHAGKYYLFSLNTDGQLYYSIIDISLNGGNGDIVSGKKGVYIDRNLTEKMTVVKGCNNTWLIARSLIANQYKAYEIRDTGIITTPVVSGIGSLPLSWYRGGVIKFSADGTKMAAACNQGSAPVGGLELYDFDYHTGKLSNARLLDSGSSNGYYYGACFSQDNTKLYVTTSAYNIRGMIYPGKIKQFDISLGTTVAIMASNTLLYTDTAAQNFDLGDLKRGIDGKIYISVQNISSASAHMHVISSPNAAGLACGFMPDALSLPLGSWLYKGLPNDIVILDVPDTLRTANDITACFTDSIKIAALDTGGKDYVWQDSTNGAYRTFHTDGIYSVGYVNANCKYETDVFKVHFVRLPATSPNSYSCDGQKQGIAWIRPATGDTTLFTFTWTNNSSAVLQEHTTHTTDTLKGLDTGSYAIQVHAAGGCDTTLYINMLSIPSPQVSASIDSVACKGAAVTFSAQTDAAVWKWYLGDGAESDSLAFQHTYKRAGIYTTQFIAENLEGCSDTVTKTVQVYTFSFALSSDKDNLNIGDQVTLQTTSAQQYSITAWEPSHLFTDPLAFSQAFIIDTTLTVTVSAISVNGCVDSEAITLSVNPQVFIPSAFSPNGDGLNDRFRPRTAGSGVFIDDFEIYNRWGQMIWYGYGATAAEGWDGTFHGISAEVGTYFYTIHMVTPSGGAIARKGDVTLIR